MPSQIPNNMRRLTFGDFVALQLMVTFSLTTHGGETMEADIDFNDGTITLVCSKCGRKYLNQIADTRFGIQISCECKSVISWRDDLTWVTGYARSYQRNGADGSL